MIKLFPKHKMATKYKLTYFDIQGYAEPIRFIFAYKNQEYEDVRLTHEEWNAIKSTTPFGKVPILEIDDKPPIAQSSAIARYLANQFGLTGKDAWDALQCDVLVDTLLDFMRNFVQMMFETDADKKEAKKKEIVEKEIPFYFEKFDKIIAANQDGYLVGSQVTWADLYFAATLGSFEDKMPGFLAAYPSLEKLVNKINNIPSIKAWIQKRPVRPIPISL